MFGLFSKEKTLQRTIDRATNKLAQQADRFPAMEKLLQEGTEDSLAGLCKRFSVTSSKSVEDEQEKSWVVDSLVSKGELALPAVRRYLKTAEGLSFPLKVLERIAEKDKVLEVVDEILAGEPPGYVRHPERRIDLVRWLAEWSAGTSEEISSRLKPYLADFDENVRFAVIEGLSHHDVESVGAPLVAATIRPEEESGRIRRRLIEVLADRKVPLGEHAAAVSALLTGPLAAFVVEGDVVKRR
jgi:HEAT repeat protein